MLILLKELDFFSKLKIINSRGTKPAYRKLKYANSLESGARQKLLCSGNSGNRVPVRLKIKDDQLSFTSDSKTNIEKDIEFSFIY